MTPTSNKAATYKPTNIPWLGDIPSDWEVRRLKFLCKINMGQSPDSNDYEFEENEFPFLQGNAEFGEINPIPKLWCKTSNKVCDIGDILLSVRAPVGALNFADKNYGIGRGLCAIRGEKLNQKYLYLLLDCANSELNNMATGSTFTAISTDDVRTLSVPLPPLQTQTAIANYLDTKCELIAKYISDKKQIIDLLREQKKSLIYNAVTGKIPLLRGGSGADGVFQNTKLKSSGVEWLGDIPAHWEVRRLKDICKINPTKGDIVKTEKEVVFLPMEKVNANGEIEQDLIKPTNQLSTGFTYFEKNDIIFAKITPCFENGKGAYLDKLETEYGFGSTEFHVLRANLQLTIPRYIDYIRRSDSFMNIGETFMQGSAGQKRITTDFIKDFSVPLPPLQTQQTIVTYLDNQTAIIDDTMGKIQREIELIQEYKKSLIYGAVTGKVIINN